MGRTLRALVSTALLIEIATVFSVVTVWVILSQLHVPQFFFAPALGLTGLAMLVLAVKVFSMALASERRIDEALATTVEVDVVLPALKPTGELNPNEIPGSSRPNEDRLVPNLGTVHQKRDRFRL